jgi:Ran GTPase-activating protein (RanGAP) involved in mRNA processing and transport
MSSQILVLALRIAGNVPQMPSLQHLDVSHNPLSSEAGPHLQTWLAPAAHSLRTLSLSHTNIGDAGAAGLAALLTTAPLVRLQALDLSHCGISASGIEALMHAVTQTSLPALDNLSLSDNPLGKVCPL